jgi:hypothetical protein
MPLPGDCLPPDKLLEMKNKVIKYLNGESAKPSTATVQYLYCVIKNYAVEAGDVRATEPVRGGGMMSGLATSLGFKSAELTGEQIDDDDGTEDVADTDKVNGTDDGGDPLHPKPVLDPKWKSHYEAVFADEQDVFRSQKVDRTLADYREAVRQSQAASQVAIEAKAVQKRDDRLQDRERAQRAKRDNYVERTGRRPTCPVMAGSRTCNGDACADRYPDEKFVHPTVCKDKTHVVRGEVGGCLLFHFWPDKAKSAKNSRGGTSGRYSGGYPRQTGQRQGNPPRPSHPVTQANSKAVRDLKAKLSKARTDLKAERLGKRPTYTQVAAPTMPQQVLLAPQPPLQHVQIPQPAPPASKGDKLAEALKMMAEQLAIISAMA